MTKQSKKTQGMVGGYLQTNNCSWCYLEPAPPFDAAAAFAAWWEAPAELTRWQWTNLQLLQDLRVTNRVFFCCHRTVCESQRQQLISLVTSRRSLPKGKVETRSHGGNWKPLLLEPSSGISKSAETEPLLQVTQAACTGVTQGARNVRWDTFCFMLNRVLALGVENGFVWKCTPNYGFFGEHDKPLHFLGTPFFDEPTCGTPFHPWSYALQEAPEETWTTRLNWRARRSSARLHWV